MSYLFFLFYSILIPVCNGMRPCNRCEKKGVCCEDRVTKPKKAHNRLRVKTKAHTRACSNCFGQKLRCSSTSSPYSYPCNRCLRNNIECLPPVDAVSVPSTPPSSSICNLPIDQFDEFLNIPGHVDLMQELQRRCPVELRPVSAFKTPDHSPVKQYDDNSVQRREFIALCALASLNK